MAGMMALPYGGYENKNTPFETKPITKDDNEID